MKELRGEGTVETLMRGESCLKIRQMTNTSADKFSYFPQDTVVSAPPLTFILMIVPSSTMSTQLQRGRGEVWRGGARGFDLLVFG